MHCFCDFNDTYVVQKVIVTFEFFLMHLRSREMLSDARQSRSNYRAFLCIQLEIVNKMIKKAIVTFEFLLMHLKAKEMLKSNSKNTKNTQNTKIMDPESSPSCSWSRKSWSWRSWNWRYSCGWSCSWMKWSLGSWCSSESFRAPSFLYFLYFLYFLKYFWASLLLLDA